MSTPLAPSWQSFPVRIAEEYDIGWTRLEPFVEAQVRGGLELLPDFQRGHVWTEPQARAWLETILLHGDAPRTILTATNRTVLRSACPEEPFHVLLDGAQRLQTLRRFLGGQLGILATPERPEGWRFPELRGVFRDVLYHLRWRTLSVNDRLEVYDHYLGLNQGGTPHAPADLARVVALRDAARAARATRGHRGL